MNISSINSIVPDNTTQWSRFMRRSGRVHCGNMKFNPPYHIAAVLIAFFIIIINILVLVLISRNKKLRKTPANFLLLSFSLNDLFSGVSIIIHVLPYYYFAFHGCAQYRLMFQQGYLIGAHMISYLLLLCAVGHLLLLSSERFISLYYALRYYSLVTGFRVFIACCFVWLVTSLVTLVQLLWIFPFITSTDKRKELPVFRMHNYRYTLVIVIAFFFIPAVVLITQYSWLFSLIQRLVQSEPGTRKTDQSLKERKALVIYCAMFMCFLVCCLPYMTIQLVSQVDIGLTKQLPPAFLEMIFLLRYIVSIVNPILYTLYKRDFRSAAKMTLLNPLRKLIFKDFEHNHGQKIYLSTRDANSSYVDNSMSDNASSSDYTSLRHFQNGTNNNNRLSPSGFECDYNKQVPVEGQLLLDV